MRGKVRMPIEKVLFDTDIGTDIDDALALTYLLCEPRCELLGVTTVTGEPERRAEMVSAVCRHLGRGAVPVHVGCESALFIDMPQKQAQQADALGTWPHKKFTRLNTAIAFLRETIRANPGEVTLLAVGPMTNIGVLFATDPALPALLKRLVLMCGRFHTALGGEWNARCDPHAAAIAYGNTFHARPPLHVSYGLDVTTQVRLPSDEARERFAAIPALAPVRDFAEVWFSRCPQVTFHDPLAAVGLFDPDVCTYEDRFVDVSLAAPTLGWTVPRDEGKEQPHRLAVTVDPARFFARFFDTLAAFAPSARRPARRKRQPRATT